MRDTICVGEPKNCYYQSPANCNLMVAITTTHNKYYFELFGVQEKSDPGQSKEFVAVGLSKMGVKLVYSFNTTKLKIVKYYLKWVKACKNSLLSFLGQC